MGMRVDYTQAYVNRGNFLLHELIMYYIFSYTGLP